MSASCRRILVQLVASQKQINLTRKRGAVFTGNHAATRRRQKEATENRDLSRQRNSLPMHLRMRPHPRPNGQAAGPSSPSSFEEGGIGFNGTPLLFIFLGVFWPRSNGPTWPRLFIKSVPNRAPCWALTRPVSRHCAIRNGGPLFHEQQVRRTWRLANDADSQPTCNPSCVFYIDDVKLGTRGSCGRCLPDIAPLYSFFPQYSSIEQDDLLGEVNYISLFTCDIIDTMVLLLYHDKENWFLELYNLQ